jgi:hypothetical protein
MGFTVYANAAETRKDELGQKWIVVLKEFLNIMLGTF